MEFPGADKRAVSFLEPTPGRFFDLQTDDPGGKARPYRHLLVLDVDFILGGHLAKYFTEADIQYLYGQLRRSCPFEDRDDYIRISKMPSHNITIGAALPYIQRFLDDIGPATASKTEET